MNGGPGTLVHNSFTGPGYRKGRAPKGGKGHAKSWKSILRKGGGSAPSICGGRLLWADCAIHSIFALLDLYSGGCLTRTWLFSYCTLRRVGYLHRLASLPYTYIIPHFKWFVKGFWEISHDFILYLAVADYAHLLWFYCLAFPLDTYIISHFAPFVNEYSVLIL